MKIDPQALANAAAGGSTTRTQVVPPPQNPTVQPPQTPVNTHQHPAPAPPPRSYTPDRSDPNGWMFVTRRNLLLILISGWGLFAVSTWANQQGHYQIMLPALAGGLFVGGVLADKLAPWWNRWVRDIAIGFWLSQSIVWLILEPLGKTTPK